VLKGADREKFVLEKFVLENMGSRDLCLRDLGSRILNEEFSLERFGLGCGLEHLGWGNLGSRNSGLKNLTGTFALEILLTKIDPGNEHPVLLVLISLEYRSATRGATPQRRCAP
jgi:hypothetical protein